MSQRIHNFSAGPGVLPESVLQHAREDLWNHGDHGIGIVECSHRSAQFEEVIAGARARIHRLLGCADDQEVLFLHGGARTQFFMMPMNLLRGGRASYHNTGTWARGAIQDARRYGQVDVVYDSEDRGYTSVPRHGDALPPRDGSVYLHYTSNNTVAGTEYHYRPQVPDGTWLACDMSSNFLSRPVDGSAFGFIYAGAQKNVGASGSTVVVIRKSLLEQCDDTMPAMLNYPTQAKKGSMLNTPCTFSIYTIARVTKWLEELGGVAAIERQNVAQATRIYDEIDRTDFWRGKVEDHCRSRMNITFTTGNPELDTTFWQSAAKEGMNGLKGHRSVGGLRASVYNAQTDQAIDALLDYMRHFQATYG